jgi:hypothetical protein
MMLLARFYELWRKERMDPTEALRQAQQWVRDTTNGQKRDHFRGSLPEFSGSGMPAAAAGALYQACALLPSKK